MGSLEQLLGSRTVFATLYTQFRLLHSATTGLALVMLWILSPLGGQSALQILQTGLKSEETQGFLQQFNLNSQSQFADWIENSSGSFDTTESQKAVLNSMYTAALLSPDAVKASSMDLWGNVKVPYFSGAGGLGSTTWIGVSSAYPDAYTSLVGIPTTEQPPGNSSFSFESSYLDLQCTNISTFFAQDYNTIDGFSETGSFIALDSNALNTSNTCSTNCAQISNGTFQGLNGLDNSSVTWSLGIDRFVDSYWYNSSVVQSRTNYRYGAQYAYPGFLANESAIEASQATLLLQIRNVVPQMYLSPNITYTSAWCKASQVYVENRVNVPSSRSESRAIVPSPLKDRHRLNTHHPISHICLGPRSSNG